MSDDRYAPPQAAVTDIETPIDPNAPRKRPAWVWVICIYYWLSVPLGTAAMLYVLVSPEVTRVSVLAQERTTTVAVGIIGMWAGLVAATQLFRLRANAPALFTLALSLYVLAGFVVPAVTNSIAVDAMAGNAVGFCFLALITWYAWRLKRKGILK